MPNVKGSPISLPSKAATMKNGGMMDKLFTMLKSTRLEGSEETDERVRYLSVVHEYLKVNIIDKKLLQTTIKIV